MENKEEVVVDKEVVVEKEEVKVSPDEERAISLGWKPKDQWQGEEDDWVPAKHWLKYGDLEHELMSERQSSKHKDKVMGVMKGHHLRLKEDAKKEIEQTIRRQKQDAIKEEDFQRVAVLDAKLDVLKENLDKRFVDADSQANREIPQASGPPPEFFEWNRSNSWYKLGSSTDEMTSEADTIAMGYQTRNPSAPYKECLKYVEDKIKKLYPENFKKEEVNTAVDDGGSTRSTSTVFKKGGYKLNEMEKAAAAGFGMTEAEYAKELEVYDKRRGVL